MWQIVLLCTPRRRQITEVLGVHETLFERPFRNRQKEKCDKTQGQSLHQPIYDDHILPAISARIHHCYSLFHIVYKLGTCEASRFEFESAVPIRFESDGPNPKFSNRPCLPIARRSQTTQTINGT